MSTIIAEKLIEEVRKRPVLYDQSNELYRNVEHKDQVWKRVAKELNIEGQDEECKKKWNGIRDSLRRALQKKKTKCGQLATSATKYRYEALLEFLIPHLAERKTLCNAPDEDGDSPETVDESQQLNLPQDTQQLLDGGCADEPETHEPSPPPPPTIPVSQVAIVKKFSHAARKRKLSDTEVKSQESASSQLMAYILAEKEAEKRSQPSEKHPVDAFLAGIAPSLKSLDPFLLIAAKGKIFDIVQEYELEQLRVHRERGTTLAYMSSVSSGEASSVATPSNVEDPTIENMKVEVEDIELQEPHTEFVQASSDSSLKMEDVDTRSSDFLQNDNSSECELFGKYVAEELRVLPYLERLDLQQKITECFKKVI